jgi:hypothetical protein
MKYVLLAYGDEQQLEAMSSAERAVFADACQANDEALRADGYLLAVENLQGSCTATTVRVQHGSVTVNIGPLAEAKERLIGIFTIAARDLNEAIQVAAHMPQSRCGPIEVRPIVSPD